MENHMNIWLYIDNYRGFKDTFIPLKQVNFLVGENSTGKTSILSLIALLGTTDFWFRQEFNTEHNKLGRFDDLVSGQGKVNRQFKVGFIAPSSNNGKLTTTNYEGLMMVFEKKANNPIVCQLYYADTNGNTSVNIIGNRAYFYNYSNSKPSGSVEGIFAIFKEWNFIGKKAINENEPLKVTEYPFPREIGLPFLLAEMKSLHGKEADQKIESFSFDFPAPQFAQHIVWFAPIRSKPRRTYDEFNLEFNPEGEHTPYLIRRLLKKRNFQEFIEKFGRESGLFESIRIKGYGREMVSPFELQVILSNLQLAIPNVGYGISQALPVVVELFSRPKGTQFAIQQPEVHLHPKAQAALGDVIYQMANEEKKQFYVETHSDYTIDRFRLNYKNNPIDTHINSQILFFHRNSEGNNVTPIEILENGEYPEEQPKEFRDFFIHEQMKLLGL